MKLIHILNVAIYLCCLLLTLSTLIYNDKSFYVIYSYIILGITQPILAFIILFFCGILTKDKRDLLYGYWGLIIIFFTLLTVVGILHIDNEIVMKLLSIIPSLIATHFLYVTYSLLKN